MNGVTLKSALYPVAHITMSISSRTVPSTNSIELGPIKRLILCNEVKDPSLSAVRVFSVKALGDKLRDGGGSSPHAGGRSPYVRFIMRVMTRSRSHLVKFGKARCRAMPIWRLRQVDNISGGKPFRYLGTISAPRRCDM